MRERILEFERQHPILYCIIVGLPVLIALPGIPLALMIWQSTLLYTFEFLQPAEQLVQVQLIQTDDTIGLYENAPEEIPIMLDDAGTVVVELDPSAHAAFLADFSDVPCHKTGNDPASYIRDGTILLTYKDGSREWIAAHGHFYQDIASDKCSMSRFYFEEEFFDALLRSYGY